MTRQVATGILVILVAPLLSAHSTAAQGGQSQSASAVEQAVTQLEKDWTQAWLKKDATILERILADDWVGIDYTGKTMTKGESINELKSGASSTLSFEFGPMKVRVYGDTAIVNGSDTERSTTRGKDSTGHYVWTDVFVRRNGRWQVVSSQGIKTN